MGAAHATIAAAVFLWLGFVLAISFLEAPLKFRAPGVTLPIGLGIGRLVFKALNLVELVLAAVVVVARLVEPTSTVASLALIAAVVVLVAQLVAVRPALTRRSDAVLAGGPTESRSHTHLVYIALELLKVVALAVAGVAVLASS